MTSVPENILRLAARLADEAGEIIRPYFRSGLGSEAKSDASPVTAADRAVEKRLREIIEKERPEDGIYGEEFGVKDSRNGYSWILDPIDGTKSFIVGRPTFGTLIALRQEENFVMGIIDQPIQQERWVGAKGLPTTFNGKPVRTKSCTSLKDARAGSTAPGQFKGREQLIWKIKGAVNFMVWGGDCYMTGLLASGGLDLMIEGGMQPYDYAALVPIVEGAGGLMTDWQGRALTMESGGYTLAVGDPALQEAAVELLNG